MHGVFLFGTGNDPDLRNTAESTHMSSTPSPRPASPARSTGPSRLAIIVLYTLSAFLITCLVALGTWQVQRLGWKLDLIQRIEARAHAEPVALVPSHEWATIKPEDYEYRRVQVSGQFQHDKEAAVYTVTDYGPGYWIMTPLRQQDGSTLIINRGFVPTDKRLPETRQQGQITGPVTLVGLMRAPEHGGLFLRTNDPANARWYSRNVEEIAAATGLSDTAPFYIDADASPNEGGLPIGGLTQLKFPNSHLSYAITWYVLALMVAVATWYVRRNMNTRRQRTVED
jgi:surfeit locus 1 family protein